MLYLKITLLSFLLMFTSLANAQLGILKGKITEIDSITPIPYAKVSIEAGGVQLWETFSDIDGRYTIGHISVGKYTVKFFSAGYKTVYVTDVIIQAEKITFLDVISVKTLSSRSIIIQEYVVPLIEKDASPSGETIIIRSP